MSKETQDWLDQNILVGLTHPDYGFGEAWHRRSGSSNSYPGPIPYEDVERKLFNWNPVKVTPHFSRSELAPMDDLDYVPLMDMKGDQPVALVCSDNGAYLGMFTDRYADTNYRDRLLTMTQEIVGTDLLISGAGLLDSRKKAYVQIMTDEVKTHAGERYAPFITAVSSLDGTVRTSWKSGVIRVVCDNTLEAFMSAKGQRKYGFKNTQNMGVNVTSAQEALGILESTEDMFTVALDEMLSVPVSDEQWDKITYRIYSGEGTRAENNRAALSEVYFNDPMVGPFTGTSWGAYQAVNTYQGWYQSFHGENRMERNLIRDVTGRTSEADDKTMAALTAVLG